MQTSTHEQGLMAIDEQQRTYHRFLIAARYVALTTIVVGTLLIVGYCTSAPWLTAWLVALIELGVGLFMSRDRKRVSWPSKIATLVVSTESEGGDPILDQIADERRALISQGVDPRTGGRLDTGARNVPLHA
jgi:hypothetical protein